MRNSSHTEPLAHDGVAFAIVMGADYCSEHEWGITDMQRLLGLIDGDGIEGRRIRNTRSLSCTKTNGRVYFGNVALMEHRDAQEVKGKPASEWDGCNFLMSATEGTAEAALMRDIYQACEKGDGFLLTFGSRNPFGRGGLAVGMIDKLPQMYKDQLLENDLASAALEKAWKPVREHLDGLLANPTFHELHKKYLWKYEWQREKLSYFALSPKRLEDGPVEGSAYPFMLWLNPNEQDLYASGWYTVEQIEQWSRGEGPVIYNSRLYRLNKAREDWLADRTFEVPDYFGICPDCKELLHFGYGPWREVNPVRDYSSKKVAQCPACGCASKKFIMSERMHVHGKW